MKVYVVVLMTPYDLDCILEIFGSQENADEFAAQLRERNKQHEDMGYRVDEREVK